MKRGSATVVVILLILISSMAVVGMKYLGHTGTSAATPSGAMTAITGAATCSGAIDTSTGKCSVSCGSSQSCDGRSPGPFSYGKVCSNNCQVVNAPPEDCDDGIDNDVDVTTDCADIDCKTDAACCNADGTSDYDSKCYQGCGAEDKCEGISPDSNLNTCDAYNTGILDRCGNNCHVYDRVSATCTTNCASTAANCAGIPPGSCSVTQGKVCSATDCSEINVAEICDGHDNDCDGFIDEGGVCNDVNNCGSYQNACTKPENKNVYTIGCSNAQCVITACNTGYKNCDGTYNNGCEVNSATDANNCGACNNICIATQATVTCTSGACAIASCNSGYKNCNGVYADGCEINTNIDKNNCGACNTVCADVAHASELCTSGTCTLACDAGYTNKDGNYANGCEHQLTEICNNNQDDNNNQLVDCQDPECDKVGYCEYSTELTCNDSIDNNAGGGTDCADSYCDGKECGTSSCPSGSTGTCVKKCQWSPNTPYCLNCVVKDYCHETACSDGTDNDNDGFIDCQDTDCQSLKSCGKEIAAPFNVFETTYPYSADKVYWNNCQYVDGGWNAVDNYCKCAGYAGALDASSKAACYCWSDSVSSSYKWDTSTCPPTKGANQGVTLYVTKVHCKYADTETNCTDLIDNDGDGNTDCDDSDCANNVACCGASAFYKDADGDGYGNLSSPTYACEAKTGYVANSGDCNDGNSAVHPGATELCNNKDDNCDGTIDEGCACVSGNQQQCGSDVGECSKGNQTCVNGAWGSCTGSVEPATETCNGKDDNCNGVVDEGVKLTFYKDSDGDSYGNLTETAQACTAPAGYVANSGDCNDGNSAVNPGATEICNLKDDTCDGVVDEGCACSPPGKKQTCGSSIGECKAGNQTCLANGTWGDTCAGEIKSVAEICNSKDDDCNGVIDNGLTNSTFYKDDDSDGYGTNITIQACAKPSGYAASSSDCDDVRSSVHPGATENCINKIDDNCNGLIDAKSEGCAQQANNTIGEQIIPDPKLGNGKCEAGETQLNAPVDCGCPTGKELVGSECKDIEQVQQQESTEVCGNDIAGGSEKCDGADDSSCPGACNSDCTCAFLINDGVCAKDLGENSENSPEDCSFKYSSLVILLVVLFTILGGGIGYWYFKIKPREKLGGMAEDYGLGETKPVPEEKAPESIGSYISETLSMGFSPEQIRAALVNKGWDVDLVDKKLQSVASKPEEEES